MVDEKGADKPEKGAPPHAEPEAQEVAPDQEELDQEELDQVEPDGHKNATDTSTATPPLDAVPLADPHGGGPIFIPTWPATPQGWLRRGWYQWLDYGIYRVESVLVVAALALMPIMIGFEILHLALLTDESKLAGFFIKVIARFQGGELSAGSQETITGAVVGLELVIYVLLCHVAAWTRLEGAKLWFKEVAALAVLGGTFGFAELVHTQPSRVAYLTLLGLFMVGTGVAWFRSPTDGARNGTLRTERLHVFIAILAATPVLFWLIQGLPDDYSFAEKHSLFVLLWVGFLGASMATYQHAHLKIDFIRKIMKPGRTRSLYTALSVAFTLAFTCVFLIIAWDYVFSPEDGMVTNRTVTGEIPDWLKVLAIPASLAIMCGRFLRHALEQAADGLGIAAQNGAAKEAHDA